MSSNDTPNCPKCGYPSCPLCDARCPVCHPEKLDPFSDAVPTRCTFCSTIARLTRYTSETERELDAIKEQADKIIEDTTPTKRPTCALIVGHRKSSQGATAPNGTSEWDFNRSLAEQIKQRSKFASVEIVYRDDSPGGYKALPAKVNRLDPDFAVSMHFNSFAERPGQPEVSGTEVLHFPGSTGGTKLAGLLQEEFLEALGLPDRGLKARGRSGRGGTILAGTACPCVLAEPFFGDNPLDWGRATERTDALAQAYANAIDRYAQTL